jgi:hypothetical protein
MDDSLGIQLRQIRHDDGSDAAEVGVPVKVDRFEERTRSLGAFGLGFLLACFALLILYTGEAYESVKQVKQEKPYTQNIRTPFINVTGESEGSSVLDVIEGLKAVNTTTERLVDLTRKPTKRPTISPTKRRVTKRPSRKPTKKPTSKKSKSKSKKSGG